MIPKYWIIPPPLKITWIRSSSHHTYVYQLIWKQGRTLILYVHKWYDGCNFAEKIHFITHYWCFCSSQPSYDVPRKRIIIVYIYIISQAKKFFLFHWISPTPKQPKYISEHVYLPYAISGNKYFSFEKICLLLNM